MRNIVLINVSVAIWFGHTHWRIVTVRRDVPLGDVDRYLFVIFQRARVLGQRIRDLLNYKWRNRSTKRILSNCWIFISPSVKIHIISTVSHEVVLPSNVLSLPTDHVQEFTKDFFVGREAKLNYFRTVIVLSLFKTKVHCWQVKIKLSGFVN